MILMRGWNRLLHGGKRRTYSVALRDKELGYCLHSFIHHIILFVLIDNKINYFTNYCLAVLHGIRGINSKKPS